ncbi:MAG TPA: porin [Gammaproteobacteria bacterium]
MTSWDLRDGMFRFQIGVRAQLDATYGVEDDAIEEVLGSIDDGLSLRRGRVFAKGRLLRAMDFWVEFDVGEDPGLKQAYIDGVRPADWISNRFRWRIGKFQEPFSIGRLTSSNYAGFLERGLPADTFAPGRNVGLMLRHPENNDRLTWAASLTTDGGSTADNPNNSELTFSGRVTGLPLLFEDGGFVHVGIALSNRRPTDDDIRYQARPEARSAPVYADTGRIASDRARLLGVELAVVRRSYWLQSEWIRAAVEAPAVGDPRFTGGYLEIGRFLTGEQRAYDRAEGTFHRVTPNTLYRGGNPLRSDAPQGAFEVTARYSTVDLTDASISGGTMRNVALGLNWYLNSESRVMLNYVHSKLRGVGDADILLLRFQYNP